jgi:hypothetical protein
MQDCWLTRLDRFHRIVLLEEVEQHPKGVAAWRLEVQVAGDDQSGVVAGRLTRSARLPDRRGGNRASRLALSEELAGTSEAQIFLRDLEAVFGRAQAVEGARGGFPGLAEQHA